MTTIIDRNAIKVCFVVLTATWCVASSSCSDSVGLSHPADGTSSTLSLPSVKNELDSYFDNSAKTFKVECTELITRFSVPTG